MTSLRRERGTRAIFWVAIALLASAGLVLLPLAPWVVLALWTAGMMRRFHVPLGHALGDRPRLAALLLVAFLVMLLVPVVVLITLLVGDAIALLQSLRSSARVQEMLQALVTGDGDQRHAPDVLGVAMNQAERLWSVARQIAGTAAHLVIGLVIAIVGTYAFLTDGPSWFRWVEAHSQLPASVVRRFAAAFDETGRGLFVGIVGAGLAQSIIATILYLALGVPQPFALGFLTLCASAVPVAGTGLVWVPVAAGLALADRPVAAVVLVIAGVAVIGTIDNVVRPYLARRGHLQLPTYVVLLAMFGGIEIMGAWGLLIGPLLVRLAKEAAMIARLPGPTHHCRALAPTAPSSPDPCVEATRNPARRALFVRD